MRTIHTFSFWIYRFFMFFVNFFKVFLFACSNLKQAYGSNKRYQFYHCICHLLFFPKTSFNLLKNLSTFQSVFSALNAEFAYKKSHFLFFYDKILNLLKNTHNYSRLPYIQFFFYNHRCSLSCLRALVLAHQSYSKRLSSFAENDRSVSPMSRH